jgi:hypothetical protein
MTIFFWQFRQPRITRITLIFFTTPKRDGLRRKSEKKHEEFFDLPVLSLNRPEKRLHFDWFDKLTTGTLRAG